MIGALILKKKLHASFDYFGKHDLRKFLKDWAENSVFIYPGTTSLAGRFEGRKAVEAWFQRYMKSFPRIEFTLKSISVQNTLALLSNVATVEWDVSVTNEKGEDYAYGGLTVIHVDKAKVVLAKDYIFDTEILKKALGE
jgi:ketosteroid isomerase-like protein